MRVVDDAAYHSEHDLNMLLTFAVSLLFGFAHQMLRATLTKKKPDSLQSLPRHLPMTI